jgi:hypothetical protein
MSRGISFFDGQTLIGLRNRLLGDGDTRFRRQARDNLVTHLFNTLRVEKNFHRNPLDDLDKIASSVVGRQQSEIFCCCSGGFEFFLPA